MDRTGSATICHLLNSVPTDRVPANRTSPPDSAAAISAISAIAANDAIDAGTLPGVIRRHSVRPFCYLAGIGKKARGSCIRAG
jgi:hypothetical protein